MSRIQPLLAAIVSLHCSFDLLSEALQLLSSKAVDKLHARHVAPAHHVVPDAVVYLASRAMDQRKVCEVGAVVALMRIFGHLFSILH